MTDTTDNLLRLIEEHTAVVFDRDVFDSRQLIEGREQAESVDDDDEDIEILKAIIEEVNDLENELGDEFKYGVTFVADSYFEQYAQDFAEDVGAVKDEHDWPLNCIDWEKAARELKMDFTSVSIQGEEYWVR